MLSLVGFLSCVKGAGDGKCEFDVPSTASNKGFPKDCSGGGNADGCGIGDGDCDAES